MSPSGIAQVLRALPPRSTHPDLLVGTETCDDAGVYRLAPDLALVQTLDFFPPVVDDPYVFGQIAAANALSDVYAMNGRPLTAMNITAFPDNELSLDILAEILRGAAERVTAAGAVTVGGHSVRDAEVKFGLSVTGLVHPDELLTNAEAKVGDVLILTKPLGTGFVTTANKRGIVSEATLDAAVASMTALNEVGRDVVRLFRPHVHALTDVTGYGLAGHAAEMAEGAGVTLVLHSTRFPAIEGVEAIAGKSLYSRANKSNRENLEGRLLIDDSADPLGIELAFDPQTSGGLLIALAREVAEEAQAELRRRGALAWNIVGEVVPRIESIAIRIVGEAELR